MIKNNEIRLSIVLCGALLAAACQDASPTAPTEPEPPAAPVLTGSWSGTFEGSLVTGASQATFTQDGTAVTGEWSAPMPQPLVDLGAPAALPLSGPVTGTVAGTTADLTFGFSEVYHAYLGTPDCGLAVSVTSFDATALAATWTTNTSCMPPITDSGTLTLARQ